MKVINNTVPVVMFHSLTCATNDSFYLSSRTDLFVESVRLLLDFGYRFITIQDIVYRNYNPKHHNICFTFDDGFLDNYHILYPILKYFGICCSIFLASDFIAENSISELEYTSKWTRPFLSKAQIREMHNSGLVDFQGHSKTHTWYPISGEVVSNHTIDSLSKYYWIYWNAYPEKKPYQINKSIYTSHSDFVTFNYERSLASRRFITNFDEFSSSGMKSVTGDIETFDEMITRFREEIIWDKANLENLLQKELCFFCWPGGEMCKDSYIVFQQSGYKACSVPSNPIKALIAKELFSENQQVIKRISPSYYWKGSLLGPLYFLHSVKQFTRGSRSTWLFRKLSPRLLRLKDTLSGWAT